MRNYYLYKWGVLVTLRKDKLEHASQNLAEAVAKVDKSAIQFGQSSLCKYKILSQLAMLFRFLLKWAYHRITVKMVIRSYDGLHK